MTPGKGYDIKSVSRGMNLAFYDERLQSYYTPIRGESLQDGKVNLIMLHLAPSEDELLLSIVGRGPDDELGRPTFMNHTAVVPLDRVRTGELRLSSVEQAVRAFDAAQGNAVGEIEPLTVATSPAAPPDELARGIRSCITFAAAETLATRILTAPSGRTLLLCRNTTSEQRIKTLELLALSLHVAAGLPWMVSMSDAPTASALSHFQLVVGARGIRADNTWTLLDGALDRPALPRPGGQEAVYGALERCFSRI